MSNTIYINSIKAKRSKYGVKLTGKAEDIIKDIQANTNSKGYINWELKERRTEGKYGETHSVTVDTWEPNKNQASENAAYATNRNDDIEAADRYTDLPF